VSAAKKWGGEDKRPPRGAELFSDPFSNIFLCAKKKSGKTTTIAHIIKETMGPDTRLIIFSSTINKDDIMIQLIHDLKEKGHDVEAHTSFTDDDGTDLLQDLVHEYEDLAKARVAAEAKKRKQAKMHPKKVKIGAGMMKLNDMDGEGEKEKKSKYLEREAIILIDDLSEEIKSPSLVSLMKKSRHFHFNILVSTQHYVDLLPGSRQQIDYYLLWRGVDEKNMLRIKADGNPAMDYLTFVKLYQDATSKTKFSFFYAGVRTDDYRRNFNEKYMVEDDNDIIDDKK
jgi:hypothetical protein